MSLDNIRRGLKSSAYHHISHCDRHCQSVTDNADTHFLADPNFAILFHALYLHDGIKVKTGGVGREMGREADKVMLGFLMHLLPWRRRLGLGITVATALMLAAPYLADLTRAGTSPNAAGPAKETPAETAPKPAPADSGQAAAATDTGAMPVAVEPDSNPRNPLDHLQKLEALRTLEFTNQGFDWRRDWWKYLVLALGSLMILYFGLHITRMLCRLAVFALCVGVGIIGSLLLEPRLAPLLANHLPADAARFFSAHHVGYVIGFLVSFGLATTLLHWLPGPLRQVVPGK